MRALLRAPRDRGAGAPHAVEREVGGFAEAHEHRGLRLELARGRDGQRLAQLALEAGLVEERGEPPPSAASTASAPGPRSPPFANGDREQVGRDAVGGSGDGREREGHEASVPSGVA